MTPWLHGCTPFVNGSDCPSSQHSRELALRQTPTPLRSNLPRERFRPWALCSRSRSAGLRLLNVWRFRCRLYDIDFEPANSHSRPEAGIGIQFWSADIRRREFSRPVTQQHQQHAQWQGLLAALHQATVAPDLLGYLRPVPGNADRVRQNFAVTPA